MKDGVTFVLMGVTGDLSKRKLLPAIHNLVKRNKIKDFAIVGVARSEGSIKDVFSSSEKFVRDHSSKVWKEMERRARYVQLDFHDAKGYEGFHEECVALERKLGLSGKRIFYLATLPDHFSSIVHNLKGVKMGGAERGWPRIVFEKPFGHDLKSARKINKEILSLIDERRIYRIDHYLGKELVSNIALLRFTNRIFEPLWCRDHVENVQIILNENFGVGNRGNFYDKYGAVRDMVQSHMLQLLSLVAMESPSELSGEVVRDRKLEIFKKLKVKDVLLGQYKGYDSERGVAEGSRTPTFGALRVEVGTERWKGVPFFLKTGKYLNETKAVIYIKFKHVECLLSESCPSDTNYLIINLKTNEGMAMVVNTKIPGEMGVEPIKLDFRIRNRYGPNTPEAYESLIEDVIAGRQYAFVRTDSIENSWRVLDPWLKKNLKVHSYSKGSNGPAEFEKWNKKNGVRWRS